MTKRLDLAALDLVNGGMDIRTLHAHIGGAGSVGHVGALPGAGGLGTTGAGPGFAPILPGHDPNDPGFGGTLYPGAHAPSPGLGGDPYAASMAMVQQPQEQHSFSSDLQAIASIANAFVGIIGAFTGHGAPAQESPANGRVETRAPAEINLGTQNDPGFGQEAMGPTGGDMLDVSTQGGHPVGTSVVAENDGVGNHTDFHETDDGFVRG